jgi:hypothetical protein
VQNGRLNAQSNVQFECSRVHLAEFYQTKSPQLSLRTFLSLRDPEGITVPFGSEFRDKKVQEFHSCFLFVFIRHQVNLVEFHQTKSPQLALRTFLSLRDPEGIRTPGRLLRRQMLYPTELPVNTDVLLHELQNVQANVQALSGYLLVKVVPIGEYRDHYFKD